MPTEHADWQRSWQLQGRPSFLNLNCGPWDEASLCWINIPWKTWCLTPPVMWPRWPYTKIAFVVRKCFAIHSSVHSYILRIAIGLLKNVSPSEPRLALFFCLTYRIAAARMQQLEAQRAPKFRNKVPYDHCAYMNNVVYLSVICVRGDRQHHFKLSACSGRLKLIDLGISWARWNVCSLVQRTRCYVN